MAWGSPGRRRQRKILNPIMPIMPSHSLVASHAHRCHLPPHNLHTPSSHGGSPACCQPAVCGRTDAPLGKCCSFQDRQQPVVATRSGLWPFCPHMPSGLMSGLRPLWLIPDGGWKYCALFILPFWTNFVIVHTFSNIRYLSRN